MYQAESRPNTVLEPDELSLQLLERDMNRYPQQQLMTIEEAQRLSDPQTSHEANEQRRRMWSWQTVAGAMGQQEITDELLDRLEGKQR